MEDICKRLGATVARVRREQGLTQEDLAGISEVQRSYIADIERGVRNPTVRVLSRIANALGVRPGSLLD